MFPKPEGRDALERFAHRINYPYDHRPSWLHREADIHLEIVSAVRYVDHPVCIASD